MTDRELLELAAKAARIELTWRTRHIQIGMADTYGVRQYRQEIQPFLIYGIFWNPLEDDGDALRLAVRLQLTICNEHISAGSAYCLGRGEAAYPEVDSGGAEDHVIPGDYAATRRAIVLAAAEIGKLLP